MELNAVEGVIQKAPVRHGLIKIFVQISLGVKRKIYRYKK